MIRIYRIFQKITRNGDVIYERREAGSIDEQGNENAGKQILMHNCPNCGQPLEEKIVIKCPVHGIYDCNWCHAEMLRLEEINFKRQMAIQKEKLRWLESKIFDGVPFVKTIRKVCGIQGITKLEETRKKLLYR